MIFKSYLIEQNIRWKPYLIEKTVDKPKSLIETFPNKIDFNQYPSEYWKKNFKDPKRNEKHWTNRIDIIADYLGINKDKVKRIDHHKAHAYYSYYTSNLIGKKILALTADGMGEPQGLPGVPSPEMGAGPPPMGGGGEPPI